MEEEILMLNVQIENWDINIPKALNENEARSIISKALRSVGITITKGSERSLAIFCINCKYKHSGDCASI